MKPRTRLLFAAAYVALAVAACVATLADTVYDRGDGLQFWPLALLDLPWTPLVVGLGALSSFTSETIEPSIRYALLTAPLAINFLWLTLPALRDIRTA